MLYYSVSEVGGVSGASSQDYDPKKKDDEEDIEDSRAGSNDEAEQSKSSGGAVAAEKAGSENTDDQKLSSNDEKALEAGLTSATGEEREALGSSMPGVNTPAREKASSEEQVKSSKKQLGEQRASGKAGKQEPVTGGILSTFQAMTGIGAEDQAKKDTGTKGSKTANDGADSPEAKTKQAGQAPSSFGFLNDLSQSAADLASGIKNNYLAPLKKDVVGADLKTEAGKKSFDAATSTMLKAKGLKEGSDEWNKSKKSMETLFSALGDSTDKVKKDTFDRLTEKTDIKDEEFMSHALTSMDQAGLDQEKQVDTLAQIMGDTLGQDPKDPAVRGQAELFTNMPHSTKAEKEIFKSTVAKLNELQEDDKLSNNDIEAKSIATISDSLAEARAASEGTASEAEQAALKENHKEVLSKFLSSQLGEGEAGEMMGKTLAGLLTDMKDDPNTDGHEAENLIGALQDLSSSVDPEELTESVKGLKDSIESGLGHLSEDEQLAKTQELVSGLIQESSFSEKYGLDKVSDEAMQAASEKLLSSLKGLGDEVPSAAQQAELAKAFLPMVAELSDENKGQMIQDLGEMAFSTDGNFSQDEQKIVDIAKSEVNNLNEDQMSTLIDFGAHMANSDMNPMDIFNSSADVAKQIGLDEKTTAAAQKLIANAGFRAMTQMAEGSGVQDVATFMAGMLSQGPNGLVGNDGELNSRDEGRITEQITSSILDTPNGPEERKGNAEAESRYQSEIRNQTRERIPGIAEARRQAGLAARPIAKIFPRIAYRKSMAMKSAGMNQAFSEANSWYPGKRGGETTQKMNQAYNSHQHEKRDGVRDEVRSQISPLTRDKQTQTMLNTVAKMKKHSDYSNIIRTDGLRLDRDMGRLQRAQAAIESNTNEISSPDAEKISSNLLDMPEKEADIRDLKDSDTKDGHFDIFRDKNDNQEFYKLTDKNNAITYALKGKDGKYKSISAGNDFSYKGKSYEDQIKQFEQKEAQKKKDIELQGSQDNKGQGTFDLFQDADSKQEFYRYTDNNGKQSYGIKTADSASGWKKLDGSNGYDFKGQSYQSQIDAFKGKYAQENVQHYKDEKLEDGGKLEMFADKKDDTRFYKWTDKEGKERFAVSQDKNDAKAWKLLNENNGYSLDGKSYRSQVEAMQTQLDMGSNATKLGEEQQYDEAKSKAYEEKQETQRIARAEKQVESLAARSNQRTAYNDSRASKARNYDVGNLKHYSSSNGISGTDIKYYQDQSSGKRFRLENNSDGSTQSLMLSTGNNTYSELSAKNNYTHNGTSYKGVYDKLTGKQTSPQASAPKQSQSSTATSSQSTSQKAAKASSSQSQVEQAAIEAKSEKEQAATDLSLLKTANGMNTKIGYYQDKATGMKFRMEKYNGNGKVESFHVTVGRNRHVRLSAANNYTHNGVSYKNVFEKLR